MSEAQKGIAAMVGACVVWGLSAMYYKQLAHVPPLEVLSHRTLWSLVFFGVVLTLQNRTAEILELFKSGRVLAMIGLAAVMISTNWFLFIYSIQVGKAVEASLGYYIFPLVAVMLGYVMLREGLTGPKWLAVAMAGIAVLVLTLRLGVAPWISVTLAVTFGLYGLIKKGTPAGPVVSVATEVLLLAPLALIWLWGVHLQGWQGLVGRNLGVFGHNWHDSLMLVGSGVITGGPLILFSYASKRISMATVGLVQYVNPTLQFLVAVLVFAEPFTRWHLIAFPIIWAALAVYSWDSVRQERVARRAAVSSGTSSTT